VPPTQPKRIRGDGRIYRRGDFYWCAFYVDGKQQRESCHTQDAAKAEKYLQRRRNQARAHELDPSMAFITRRAHKRTVGELMDALEKHFKAEDQLSAPTLSNINRVRKDFGARRATTLTASEVNSYIEERSKAGDANATINRATQILKQSYRLSGLRLPGPEPINHLDESGNVRQGFFTDPEIRRVLEHLSEDLADFVLFGWCTGTRRGEIAALQWSYVQDDCIYVPAEITKTGKAHVIPLVGELAELIERRKVARLIKRNGSVTFASHIFHRDGAPIIEFSQELAQRVHCCGVGEVGLSIVRRAEGHGERRQARLRTGCEKHLSALQQTMEERREEIFWQDIPRSEAQRSAGHGQRGRSRS